MKPARKDFYLQLKFFVVVRGGEERDVAFEDVLIIKHVTGRQDQVVIGQLIEFPQPPFNSKNNSKRNSRNQRKLSQLSLLLI